MPFTIAADPDATGRVGPHDGAWPIQDYAALGDGRTVALLAPDGGVEWWCVPNMDSPALFDRMLQPDGGFFALRPHADFECERRYQPDSNVLCTEIRTATGRARITESLNSSHAGRLPWTELARRIEGIEGEVHLRLHIRIGTFCGTRSPWIQPTSNGQIFHAGSTLGLLRRSDNVRVTREADESIEAEITVREGERAVVAILAGSDEPLGVPAIDEIDARIDTSDAAWREWANGIRYDGPYREAVRRSALALKLLLFSPSGAIAAAATTSLPEKIGGNKNWDYRYAWIRDAAYVVNAFLRIGAVPEAKAAFTWLMDRLGDHGPKVMYSLGGNAVPGEQELDDIPGYRDSRPVVLGNRAASQHQHGIYGDIFETAALFVGGGHVLDQKSSRLLSDLADECADHWRRKDAGIWELEEPQHYTMSKISCWQALSRAVALAEQGQIPKDCQPRWERERDRIAAWVDAECWSETKRSYVMHPGTDKLDAALMLGVRFGFDGPERWNATLDAIRRELGAGAGNGWLDTLRRRLPGGGGSGDSGHGGPFLFRYSGVDREEGLFLACSFWMAEALATMNREDEARTLFENALAALPPNTGTLAEMIDPDTGDHLGNTPQGLSHLALIHAACTLAGDRDAPLRAS
ncbi:MAG: glycoside hydrolase family 15 protein [Gluconacetobacter diazotrophicus]|nr:glycoside hydrolase family 15 protein [Gluconacetobacter diazotrophicus]